jgi:hypothetical protein
MDMAVQRNPLTTTHHAALHDSVIGFSRSFNPKIARPSSLTVIFNAVLPPLEDLRSDCLLHDLFRYQPRTAKVAAHPLEIVN